MKGLMWRRAALILTLAGFATASANASLVTMTGSVTVFSSAFAEIAVGDVFHFAFTYNDSFTDEDGTTTTGKFTNALTGFSLTRDASNVGAWDPSGGVFTVPNLFFTTQGPYIQLSVEGSGFPTLDGNPFGRIYLGIPILALSDTGLGQTIAQQLGGVPTFDPMGDDFGYIETATSEADFNVTLNSVPEPSGFALTATGALLLAATRRRRKRR